MKKFILLLMLTIIGLCNLQVTVNAAEDNGVPYKTYTVNQGSLEATQDAYIPVNSIQTFQYNNETIRLSNAKDIFYTNQHLYIVNGVKDSPEIIITDLNLESTRVIRHADFKEPSGVFVSNANEIYVADPVASKIFVFDNSLQLLRTHGKPDSVLYTADSLFTPTKIAVDNLDTMYIIDTSTTSGILRITKEDEFLGFYGANNVTPSFEFIIRFMLASKEQREKLYTNPVPANNLAIDHDGLICTVTSGIDTEGGGLRRLNLSGSNLLVDIQTGVIEDAGFTDIFVGPIGNYYIGSNTTGLIYEYDKDGNLLFVFGGKSKGAAMAGLFTNISGITVTENYNLFVLDSTQNVIQRFIPTDFSDTVHTAIGFYQQGKYNESKGPWLEVLRLNQTFDLAHAGLANAYLLEENYSKALEHFQLGNEKAGYSDAYLELRNLWMLQNFSIVIAIIAVVTVLGIAFYKIPAFQPAISKISDTKTKVLNKKYVKESCFVFRFIKKPFDSLYEIKYHNAVSLPTGIAFYLVFLIVILCSQMFSGFYFRAQEIETISLFETASIYIAPMLLFTVCNYLVSSINEGEARFKHILIATIFSFSPVILFTPFITLISNVLTANESFIIYFSTIVIWAWSFILLYFMIKDMQNYEAGETVKNILITIFAMILFVAVGYLLYVLSMHIVSFVQEVFREVLGRVFY